MKSSWNKKSLWWAAVLLAVASVWVVELIGAQESGRVILAQDNPYATPVDRHHAPNDVIFPAQQMPLRFFHDKHIAEDMTCDECHDSVEGSIRASDVNLPSGETCDLCHELEDGADADPPAACATCHLGFHGELVEGTNPHEDPSVLKSRPPPVVLPTPHLKFNHKAHVDKDIPCSECHEGVDGLEVATVDNALPVMGKCLECHTGTDAPGECSTCHLTDASGRMKTEFAEGKLVPHGFYRNDFHNEAFVHNHEQAAREDEGYCLNCHAQSECVDCHNGIAKPVKIHPANWILMHPITARKNSLECTSCHREQSFCIDCHRRSGIVDVSANQDLAISFHPAGWVNAPGQPPAASHHMFQAQRNIRTCVGCHEERSCLKCHSARESVGFGVQRARRINPHPVDFKSRCRSMMALNERACLKCHSSGDPSLLQCR